MKIIHIHFPRWLTIYVKIKKNLKIIVGPIPQHNEVLQKTEEKQDNLIKELKHNLEKRRLPVLSAIFFPSVGKGSSFYDAFSTSNIFDRNLVGLIFSFFPKFREFKVKPYEEIPEITFSELDLGNGNSIVVSTEGMLSKNPTKTVDSIFTDDFLLPKSNPLGLLVAITTFKCLSIENQKSNALGNPGNK